MGLDTFFNDLFATEQPGSQFNQRFLGDGGALSPMAPTRDLLGGGETMPMPRARPPALDLEFMDNPAAIPPTAQPRSGPMDIGQRLGGGPTAQAPMGVPPGGGGGPMPGGEPSVEDRLGGGGMKRIMSALAAGMAGGNPAFAGGALMKGLSGGLAGSLKSDKDDLETDTATEERNLKQGNFERVQGERELDSAARRKLYGKHGEYYEAAAKNAAEGGGRRGGRAGSAAWNKPAHERFKDAQNLILKKNKDIDGSLNVLGMPKAERDAAVARAKAEKEAFKRETYQRYGLNEDGSDVAPPRAEVPSTNRVVGDREASERGLYEPDGSEAHPHRPRTEKDFAKIPVGEIYINPRDGRLLRRRPGD